MDRSRPSLFVAAFLTAVTGFSAGAQAQFYIPGEFEGTWGTDCANPEMRFTSGVVFDLSNKLRGPLLGVEHNGDELVITYRLKVRDQSQEVTDTFLVDGSTLRLVKSVYGQKEVKWEKQPWQKCD